MMVKTDGLPGLDLDGNTHTDSRGIVAAWKELDEINQEHKPQDSKPQDHY